MSQFEEYLSVRYFNRGQDYYTENYKKGEFDIWLSKIFADLPPKECDNREQWFNDRNGFIESQFYEWLFSYPIPEAFNFLEYQYQKYLVKNDNGLPFLYFVREAIMEYPKNETGRQETIKDWVEEKRNEIKTNGKPIQDGEKIKWNGTPSQFGYIFLELVAKGYIDPPLYNGETNFKGLSRQCYQYFDIETTPGNIEKEMNPNKNTLSDVKRAKFTIPNLSDIA